MSVKQAVGDRHVGNTMNCFFPQGGLLMHDASDIMEQLIGEDESLSVPAASTQVKEESSQGDSVSVLESARGTQTNQVITHTQRLICKDEGCETPGKTQ